jgi:hypothetical protein
MSTTLKLLAASAATHQHKTFHSIVIWKMATFHALEPLANIAIPMLESELAAMKERAILS